MYTAGFLLLTVKEIAPVNYTVHPKLGTQSFNFFDRQLPFLTAKLALKVSTTLTLNSHIGCAEKETEGDSYTHICLHTEVVYFKITQLQLRSVHSPAGFQQVPAL